MPEHTPHREQCRNCTCPQGNHLHNPIDNLAAELCSCFCHQYCDCEICLPPKEVQAESTETFDANCLKVESKKESQSWPPGLKVGDIINFNGENLIVRSIENITQNGLYSIRNINCDILNKPEDPEVCHACDCFPSSHIYTCKCSCHTSCICDNCKERKLSQLKQMDEAFLKRVINCN